MQAAGLRIQSCMQVLDILTREVATVKPDASLDKAAEAMEAAGVGSPPVWQGRRLLGAITDRAHLGEAIAEISRPSLPLK